MAPAAHTRATTQQLAQCARGRRGACGSGRSRPARNERPSICGTSDDIRGGSRSLPRAPDAQLSAVGPVGASLSARPAVAPASRPRDIPRAARIAHARRPAPARPRAMPPRLVAAHRSVLPPPRDRAGRGRTGEIRIGGRAVRVIGATPLSRRAMSRGPSMPSAGSRFRLGPVARKRRPPPCAGAAAPCRRAARSVCRASGGCRARAPPRRRSRCRGRDRRPPRRRTRARPGRRCARRRSGRAACARRPRRAGRARGAQGGDLGVAQLVLAGPAGGSIASRQRICSMWFCITSLSAPAQS